MLFHTPQPGRKKPRSLIGKYLPEVDKECFDVLEKWGGSLFAILKSSSYVVLYKCIQGAL